MSLFYFFSTQVELHCDNINDFSDFIRTEIVFVKKWGQISVDFDLDLNTADIFLFINREVVLTGFRLTTLHS